MLVWSFVFACAGPDARDAEPRPAAEARLAAARGSWTPRRPLVARITADVVAGTFPLEVHFDASTSDLPTSQVRTSWSFGDGATTFGGTEATHTYVGAGTFDATVTVVDLRNGRRSVAEVAIEVTAPGCPSAAAPLSWGEVEDGGVTELSGLVASRRLDDAYWVHEDSGQVPVLVAVDGDGTTLSEQTLPDDFSDFEDLAIAIDPSSGASTLFLGDIGDNARSRDEIAVWVVEEPDPAVDGALDPLRMALVYPDGAHDAETLLVDPLTFDLYVVTKSGSAGVYVKRAPHDGEGPFVLEHAGDPGSLAGLIATAGDVSPDGLRVVVRDYTDTARLWIRDGYAPLEAAFDGEGCALPIHDEPQGEAIGFTADGLGVLTVSEGTNETLWYVGL